ncbi:MAG: endolytic transglycosylase MltG [Candidatus Eisenbacteria bacterium]
MSRKAQRGVSLRVGFLAATAGVLLALSIFAIVWSTSLFAPVREPARDSDLTLRIGRGESFRAVAADLVRLGWVSSALPIRWEARRRGWDRRVFPGYYRWRRGERVHELLARLARGEVEETKLTLPEGWGKAHPHAAGRLDPRALVDLVRTAADTTWLRAHEVPGPGIEGYLVPDTYRLPKGRARICCWHGWSRPGWRSTVTRSRRRRRSAD